MTLADRLLGSAVPLGTPAGRAPAGVAKLEEPVADSGCSSHARGRPSSSPAHKTRGLALVTTAQMRTVGAATAVAGGAAGIQA